MKAIEPFVRHRGERLFTTSLDVAEKFGKRHDSVLRSIRGVVVDAAHLGDENRNFSLRNFVERKYTDERGQAQPMFEMTRSGFSILAMGFTGKSALAWKIKYEQAFSAMEVALANQRNLSWQEQRQQGKLARREVTDTLQAFVSYATSQGSTNAKHYFKHITDASYKALFLVQYHSGQSFRDLLNAMQLSFLATAEFVAAKAIEDGMEQGLCYKDIYRLAKDRIETFAAAVPKTPVISMQPSIKQFATA